MGLVKCRSVASVGLDEQVVGERGVEQVFIGGVTVTITRQVVGRPLQQRLGFVLAPVHFQDKRLWQVFVLRFSCLFVATAGPCFCSRQGGPFMQLELAATCRKSSFR